MEMIHLRRLLKGLIYFGVTLMFAINFNEILDKFWSFLIDNGYSNEWLGAVKLLGFPIFIYFIVGLYFTVTFYLNRNPMFENSWKDVLTNGDSIDPNDSAMFGNGFRRAMEYRDSKMNTMPNEQASREYAKTTWLDTIANSKDSPTKRYVDSKLNSMTNESAYKWLKGEGE